jgi:hypothetical protein
MTMTNPIEDAIIYAKSECERDKYRGEECRAWTLIIGTPTGWETFVSVGPDNCLFNHAGERVFFNPANVARVKVEFEL